MKQLFVAYVAVMGLSLFLAANAGAGSATSTWDRFLRSYTDSSSQLLPPDPCVKDYPDKSSREYQCCSAQSGSQIIVLNPDETFDCCRDGIIPAKPFEQLTLKESEDCQRHQRPAALRFLTCVAPQQADFVDQCESLIAAKTKGKDIDFDGPKGTILTMPLCQCPSPKPVSGGVCVNFLDVDAFSLPCVAPEQKDYLKQSGFVIKEEGANYVLLTTILESRCVSLGGQIVTPTIVTDDGMSMTYAPYSNAPELAPTNPNQYVPSNPTETDEEKLCSITKPQCPCKP